MERHLRLVTDCDCPGSGTMAHVRGCYLHPEYHRRVEDVIPDMVPRAKQVISDGVSSQTVRTLTGQGKAAQIEQALAHREAERKAEHAAAVAKAKANDEQHRAQVAIVRGYAKQAKRSGNPAKRSHAEQMLAQVDVLDRAHRALIESDTD